MKPVLLFLFLSWSASGTFGQSLLSNEWMIHKGDSTQWQSASFVPVGWKPVNTGVSLERQGYGSYSGYYSLWNQVIIPAGYKSSSPGNLHLRFKIEAERAEVFFNGVSIGKSTAPGSEESLSIPVQLIRWDKYNKIMVRIYNNFYTGGSCATYITLLPDDFKRVINIDAIFPSPQHVYANTSDISFSASVNASNGLNLNGVQKAMVISDFHDTILLKSSSVKAPLGKQITSYSLKKLRPGSYQLQLKFLSDGLETQKISWFVVAPDNIKVAASDQEEVNRYWKDARKELATIMPQFNLIKVDSLCTARNNVYIAEMTSLDNIIVRGWYITPVTTGVYPAVLHLQGYGNVMKPKKYMNDTDMIHLALDIRGHGMSADKINPGFSCPGYVGYNLKDPMKYIYRGSYMDCYRAVDFLCSRKEVDTSRLAVEGHSQGGGLSLATAALCADRIKYCVTGSPFLSDFSHHIQIRTLYMDEMKYYMENDRISYEQVKKTMNLIDVINLAQYIQCPVLMGIGLFDDDCPPYIDFAVYNNIKTNKAYNIYPERGHLLGSEWSIASKAWIRKMFKID